MSHLPKVATMLVFTTLAIAGVGLSLHPGHGLPLFSYFDSWLLKVVRFSLMQAFLSAFLAVVIAIPFSWILSRSIFTGQWIVKSFLNLFFIMPVLSVILGVVNAYSNVMNVFSINGIILAHLLLNTPFAIRVIWQRLSSISANQYTIGQTLGFGKIDTWRWIEWPVIKVTVGPVFVLIFLLCFSSFAIVLTLGGGPGNTNLEVAIYQSLKFDFDPKGAAFYAFIHGSIALIFMLFFGGRSILPSEQTSEGIVVHKPPTPLQIVAIAMLAVMFFYPMFSLFERAIMEHWVGSARLPQAIMTSLVLAFGSSIVAIMFALLNSFVEKKTQLQQVLEYGLLVLPMMVVTTGLFLFFLKIGVAYKITGLLIIWLNGLMAMPLISPTIHSQISVSKLKYAPIIRTLGLSPLDQWRFIYWPAVRKVLPWSFALSLVLSIGDLGVAAMVGSAQFVTIPILIYQAMGSYQMTLASQLTILLLVICGAVLVLGEWMSERGKNA